jgi:antitoxin CptB
MRELDVLLGRYLTERWPSVGSAEREAFERFLELSDPEIYDLCLRRAESPDAAMARMADLLSPDSELSPHPDVRNSEDGRPASREPET